MAVTTQLNTGSTPIIVASGGTGVATMTTAYAPICAGTTATGPLQVASTGLSTSGFVLTSNGASAVPSFQAAGGGGLVSAQVSITAANFNAANATAVQIIAAQGANTIIVVDSVVITFVILTVAFTTGATTVLQYGNTVPATGAAAPVTLALASVAGLTSQGSYSVPPIIASNYMTSAVAVNKGIFLANNAACSGGTGSTIYVDILYHVIASH
jgi:hypothetical protein